MRHNILEVVTKDRGMYKHIEHHTKIWTYDSLVARTGEPWDCLDPLC
jgi:hypothetical protein